MDRSQAAAWVGAAGAVFSAVAAGAALRTAKAASRAAEDLTSIEAARRHQELEPQFTVRLLSMNNDSRFVRLTVELDGPIALERLSRWTLKIREDRPGRADEPTSMAGDALRREEIANQVWGPLQFTPHVGPHGHLADEHGRVDVIDRPLEVGEGEVFQLQPTRPPWRNLNDAREAARDWRHLTGTQLRLSIEAHPEQGEPWSLPIELDASPVLAPLD